MSREEKIEIRVHCPARKFLDELLTLGLEELIKKHGGGTVHLKSCEHNSEGHWLKNLKVPVLEFPEDGKNGN